MSEQILDINGKPYFVIKLLGKGKSGYKKLCEKPTPLGVGWIAQKI